MATACQGTGGAIPPGAMELIEKLRRVTQRVAQQATFDARVSEVEAYIGKLVRENNDRIVKLTKENDQLAMLAFGSDVFLQSKDGIKVPAIKKTLLESSPVFVGMFSEHTTEGREGVVRTENSADALRYVSRCIHGSRSGADADVDVDTLLEVCEVAERWQLPGALKEAAAAFGDRFDSATALKTLSSAQQHIGAGSTSAVWKDILEDAAKAVAAAMPGITKAAEFKLLSLEAIAQVMSHLQESTFELPELEGTVEDPGSKYGLWGEPVSWLKKDFDTPQIERQRFRLNMEKCGVYMDSCCKSFPTVARGRFKLTKPDGSCPWERPISESLFLGARTLGGAWGYVVEESTLANHTSDNRFRLSGSVTITKEQRQSEVFNLWLLASGMTEESLHPLSQLQCLREYASGFNFIGADGETLGAKLEERGLPTSGKPQTQRLRLRDAMLAEVSLSPALEQASAALTTLGVHYFERAVKDGSLFNLDAATISQIIARQDLKVTSEKSVLDNVVRWASYAGRTDNVIDKVMPLVRFPLVSMIKPPAKLRELKARSAVVTELVAEAIKIQLGQGCSVKKHALLPSMPSDTEQPRAKRRRSCNGDEVPKIDAASALLEFAF